MEELIFVYNADNGILRKIKDFWHKALNPSTYPCNLCLLTYGAFSMNKEWSEFIGSLDTKVSFTYRNRFRKRHDMDVTFPSAFVKREGNVQLIITSDEMNKVKTLEELKDLVSEKVVAL